MKMIINGVEFEFDSSDGDSVDKLEAATNEMNTSAEVASKTEMSTGDTLRAGVQRIKQFFISAVGTDVVGECSSLRTANSFIKQFDDYVEQDVEAVKAETEKYSAKRVR